MILKNIEKKTGLDKPAFEREYLRPRIPVVITDLIDDWPAKERWTMELFKSQYGDLLVPVCSSNYSTPGKGYMKPEKLLPFREYLEEIEKGPTDLRLFLFNIFKYAPELKEDYKVPRIMNGFMKGFPFMFFGGQNSRVTLHYDIDLSQVFLTQFHGRKKVVIFPPSESSNIYQHPFTVASHVNIDQPDYDKFPALRNAKGYSCILEPGETIFIPSGFWHYITYLDGGFSISLRANDRLMLKAYGAINIARHYMVDKSMNRLLGSKWAKIKEDLAQKRAQTGSFI